MKKTPANEPQLIPPADELEFDGVDNEVEDFPDERDEVVSVQYSITSYGADYPVDALVKRIQSGDIYIPTFQRAYVWQATKASRFIESLLLGLPVPGIFLSVEGPTRKHLVVDGQQRLRTLQYFYEGVFPPTQKQFILRNIGSKFEGTTYKSLDDEDRRRLDDSIIHATVVKQDHPEHDDSSTYLIFERLNTGGVLLNPQEIRACVYHGEFNAFLNKLNEGTSWRQIFGPISNRMRDQELILRFLALDEAFEKYEKPMKEFLNVFMRKKRHLSDAEAKKYAQDFGQPVELIQRIIGKEAFRPVRVLNAAVFDAVMVGLSRRLRKGEITDKNAFKEEYDALLEDGDFEEKTRSKTTDETTVRGRIELAINAFKDVP